MSKKEDLKRLEDLKIRVFGRVAVKLLEHEKDPYVITSSEIENHQGRVKKAIRLLKNASIISYNGEKKVNSFSYKKTYKVLTFDRDSASYKQKPSFKTKWTELLPETSSYTYSGNLSSIEEASVIGFRDVRRLSYREAIYVFHHKDEYFITDVDNSTYVYPEKDLEELQRQTIKSIVERRFQKDFQEKLTYYLGLPEGSFKNEENTLLIHRQFSYHAVAFTPEHYRGFIEEYENLKTYFEAMSHQVRKTLDLIKKKGGHAEIVKEMRKSTIQEITEEIPLKITEEAETRNYDYHREEHEKCLYHYILRHSKYLDYDCLYGDDASIIHIDNSMVDHDKMNNYGYTMENERKVIENYLKESKECMKKSISELCTSI